MIGSIHQFETFYPKPNFFIVGAPKCGTTALYTYLKAHPEVFMPEKVKEPHFFATDLKMLHLVQKPEEYFELFASATNAKALGEASTRYLYSRHAAKNIHACCPHAKIIIMLRSPIEMIYALHSQHLRSCVETYTSFSNALDAEERRLTGKEDVAPKISPEILAYRKTGLYTEQIKRYFQFFPQEQIKFIFFDDFSSNTGKIYSEVLNFLEVDPDFTIEFKKINPNQGYLLYSLHRLLHKRPYPLQTLVQKIIPKSLRNGLFMLLRNANSWKKKRPPLDPALRNSLCDYFQDDISKLSQLTGRDLLHWIEKTSLK